MFNSKSKIAQLQAEVEDLREFLHTAAFSFDSLEMVKHAQELAKKYAVKPKFKKPVDLKPFNLSTALGRGAVRRDGVTVRVLATGLEDFPLVSIPLEKGSAPALHCSFHGQVAMDYSHPADLFLPVIDNIQLITEIGPRK